MFNKVSEWFLSAMVKKYALGGIVSVWNKADGYRTQLGLAAASVVLALGFLGQMPMDKAMEIAATLGGASIATFLEKLRKHEGLIVKVSDLVKEARKPIDGPATPL